MSSKIPVAAPDLTGNEEKYVVDAIRSSWISSTGRYIQKFEDDFANTCGTDSAITVCNGTAALHVALLAIGVRPGDEVLIPSLTFVATANAVRYVGAEPVFVDVDPETWCLNPELIEEKITHRTKGIIAVHLYGHPADMDPICHLAAIHGLWVVEDAAEAHFAKYKGRPTGSLAPVATFSFYGNKIITSGEGGALTTSDRALELRMRTLRGQGVDPDRRYFFPVIGYNFRLTNVACALLCAQLERKDQIIERRHQIFDQYRGHLRSVPGINFQPQADWAEPVPWLFSITVEAREFGCSRDELIMRLAEAEIETRPFFIPVHTLPPYRENARARGGILPVTDQLAAGGLNLPTYPGLSSDEIDRICDCIKEISKK